MTAAHYLKVNPLSEVIKKYQLENEFAVECENIDQMAQLLATTIMLNKIYKSKLNQDQLDECAVILKKEFSTRFSIPQTKE